MRFHSKCHRQILQTSQGMEKCDTITSMPFTINPNQFFFFFFFFCYYFFIITLLYKAIYNKTVSNKEEEKKQQQQQKANAQYIC